MKKKLVSIICVSALGATMLAGCGNSSSDETVVEEAEDTVEAAQEEAQEMEQEDADTSELEVIEEEEGETTETAAEGEGTTVTVYAAASLETVMTDLIAQYTEEHPDIEIVGSYDSSGTLLTQIEEADGNGIDVFFSAAQTQMNTLQDDDNLVVDGTRHNVVNNQVCVITYTDSGTEVTGLDNLELASSMALADGSVPAGKYTRTALMNIGILPETDDPSEYTTEEVSEALGGLEINECSNVSKVLQAVAEQSNEVGTAYYSDTYGYEDQVEILEYISYDLTGDVIYPVAQVNNAAASEAESEAAVDFINYLISDDAKTIFESYYFDVDVED